MTTKEVELIRRAPPLHDIGKIGIPDSILLKPEKLTRDEFEQMKEHTRIGARILVDTPCHPIVRDAQGRSRCRVQAMRISLPGGYKKRRSRLRAHRGGPTSSTR
jgi:hypothetical protein